MSLPARAAAVRGDDFQYTLGWYAACKAITEPGVISVHVEDPGAGSFDDIVTRCHDGNHRYQQAKNSNYSDVAIDESWLLTASDNGKSPLEHFYNTWKRLRLDGAPAFELLANRGIDPTDPLLGLRDRNTNLLMPRAAAAGDRSNAGKALKRWEAALDISRDELLEFLHEFQIVATDNESAWRSHTKPLMRLAGLRDDDMAVRVGVDIVREWVKNGVGPRTPAEIRHEAAKAGLLAQDGRVILAVHAIDRPGSDNVPTLTLDWVDRFEGDSPRHRRLLHDKNQWPALSDELTAAEKTLGDFGVRRILVEGAMRLPLWFAVGATFPDTRRWELEVDQRGTIWSSAASEAAPEDAAQLLYVKSVDGGGEDVAVVIALTHDAGSEVLAYVREHALAGTVLAVTTQTGPGQDSVRDGTHARSWSRSARELLREELGKLPFRPARLHLFVAAPAGAVLLLGHDWNLLPDTLIYEHTDPSYAPTVLIT